MATKITKEQIIKRVSGIIEALCAKKPPKKLITDWINQKNNDLQDWVGGTCGIASKYSTNISIIEAAFSIAESQIDNGEEKLVEDL